MRRFLWGLPLLAAVPAAAQPVLVRLGAHEGFGRVVFEFTQPQAFTSERTGNALVLHFPGSGDVPDASGSARNVAAVTGGGDMATLTLVPGARLRMTRMGNRVVVDVLDPAPKKPVLASGPGKMTPPAPAVPAAATASPLATAQLAAPPQATAIRTAPPPAAASPATPPLATPPPAVVSPGAAVPAAAMPASAVPVALKPATTAAVPRGESPPPVFSPTVTLAVAATHLATPPGTKGSAVMLPFGPGVAAAAFQHGDEAWVVFDERRPVDLAGLGGDVIFAGAAVELLPTATLLRLKTGPAQTLKLDRRPDGWSLLSTEAAAPGPAIMPVAKQTRMLFAVSSPGLVVTVPDGDTGHNLLVGTLKTAGPGVPVPFHVPEFAIVPSWQGVVVEPVSDRTVLRAVPEGYAIEAGSALSPSPENGVALARAAILTRRFDFPAGPVTTLLRRLQAQVQEEGQTPSQARLNPRKAAAQTMIALGLGAEAQSLLQLAVAEDPRAAADPDVTGLSAIAALLSFRPEQADGVDSPGLSGSDEITLWRAVRKAAEREASPEAAQAFAATVGLLLAYPDALRNRLLPVAAETMVAGGASQAADAFLASMPDEPLLAFARAMRLEQKGDNASALAVYDVLANGRDRLASARAATRGTMLRLATGAFDLAQAADALEHSLGDWRGDVRERDLRLSTAGIEARAGHWRNAFSLLKETALLFPDDGPAIAARVTALLGDLLHGPGANAIAPLDLATLAEENAEAIAKSDEDGMALLLADKLMALDLPQRAAPVLERLAAAAPRGAGRAALGARLAGMRLHEGDLAAAHDALAATEATDLPAALEAERDFTDARIHALQHDIGGATAILSRLGTAEAAAERAKILAESGDWHGAALALAEAASRTLPDSGPLSPEQQDLVLRLASAQSRAGDDDALHVLGDRLGKKMSGPRADLFRLLTARPVSSPGELRRVSTDITLARALPTSLAAIGTR